jgi:aminoglycoside 3-N-acetyltransferase
MPEQDTINPGYPPLTIPLLVEQFAACGLQAGQTVLVHSSLSRLGWVAGGAVAVIRALMKVLTPAGTLMMPTGTNDNTDPANWRNPPVPESWWQPIRDHMPAYEPDITPTRQMGAIAETFRRWPGVIRSSHPTSSFAAWGKHAHLLLDHHELESSLGEESPLARLYDLDGYVLLLGVGHGNNTSLHLAEYRANFPGKRLERCGSAVLVNGARQWVTYEDLDIDADDFPQLGDQYESEHGIARGRVGQAEVRFVRQRPLIDYAVRWMEQHRQT